MMHIRHFSGLEPERGSRRPVPAKRKRKRRGDFGERASTERAHASVGVQIRLDAKSREERVDQLT
jgi:hypothetical protein